MTFLLSNKPAVTAEFVKQGIEPRLSVLKQVADKYPNYGIVAQELPNVGPIPVVRELAEDRGRPRNRHLQRPPGGPVGQTALDAAAAAVQ